MRRNRLIKGLAVGMVIALVAASTGCGNDTKTTSAGGTTEDGKAIISFMAPSFYGTDLNNENSDQVIAKYEDYTKTKVNWSWEANDTYKEKLGLTLMDKDNMPMVITISGATMPANVVSAAKQGAFWDLSEFLKDKDAYPNLSKAISGVSDAFTVNGQVIGVYRARALGRYGFSYRTDWAEKLGISEPKTIEDVYKMLYAFTYNDPDGNGKNDTYGLEMTKYTGPFDIIQTWFGCGNQWVEEGGKLVPVHQTSEYRDALKWIRKMYDDGLIRKDWATVDSATFTDAVKKGQAGAFCDVMDGSKRIWNYFTDNKVASVTDPSKTATMTMVGAVNNKTLATPGENGCYVITKAGAKTEADVKNCLHFLDKMCDNQMMVLADYGLEGITYDLDEKGQVKLRSDIAIEQCPQVGLNQSVAYIPNAASTDPVLIRKDSEIAMLKCQDENDKVAVINPAIGYLANSEANAQYGTDIEQIIDDARTQYICGQIDEAGLDEAASNWLKRGGEQVMKEVNDLYQADKK